MKHAFMKNRLSKRVSLSPIATLAACLTCSMWTPDAHADESTPPGPSQTASKESAHGGFGGKVSVSGGYGHIYSVPFYGVGLGGELGADLTKSIGLYGGIHYERSRTEYGLPVHFGQLGMTVEGILDWVRLGGGIHLAYFGLERASDHSELDKFGIGIHLVFSVDVVHTREFSLYLALKPQIDFLGKDKTPNVHAAFGVRF